MAAGEEWWEYIGAVVIGESNREERMLRDTLQYGY